MVTIDPIKLLKKYQWVLVACVIFGAFMGTAAHFAFLKLRPTFVSEVMFEVTMPQENIEDITSMGISSAEIDRIMATEKLKLVSDSMLDTLASDPRLVTQAPNWVKPYMSGGRINTTEATEALKESISSSMISGTNYFKLSVKGRTADDVFVIAGLLKDVYLSDLTRMTSVGVQEQSRVINDTVRDIDTTINSLNDQRARLLKEQTVDSLDLRTNALGQRQSLTLNQLSEAEHWITTILSRLETMEQARNSEAGVTYSDSQRSAANQDPLVQGQRQTLKVLETELQSLRERGYKPSHREFKRIQAQIDSTKQKMTDLIEETLARNFDADYDDYTQQLRSYQASQAKLSGEAETLRNELADLNRTISELDDVERKINEMISQRQTNLNSLASLTQRSKLKNASLVGVAGAERKPNRPSFPKIFMMVPAGAFLFTGLIGGLLLLRELLDTRVKGPSDVALLPRTRVVGMIAAGDEDEGNKNKIEVMFRDSADSVVAEHFRQLRTTVIKQMQRSGHQSLLIVGGMPGSGASSVVSNLGLACASMDLKVLLIDGNFRRPALHRIFEKQASPGLSDVLAGLTTLEDAAQPVDGVANLDVLTVGSAEHRQYERLGGNQMADCLGACKGKYDLVLIDVAPAMVSGDGMAIANRTDASMLVVRAYGEKRGMVARLRNELDECRSEMLGVVVNAVRSAPGGYMRQNIRASRAYHTPGMKVGTSIDHDPAEG